MATAILYFDAAAHCQQWSEAGYSETGNQHDNHYTDVD